MAASDPRLDLPTWIARVRAAVKPFDSRAAHLPDSECGGSGVPACAGPNDAERPSRERSIEELPVALAALLWGAGDFPRTLQAAVFYGRDCDSIAGMAGSLCGALRGTAALPADLVAASNAANRRDWYALADRLHGVAIACLERDRSRLAARSAALAG